MKKISIILWVLTILFLIIGIFMTKEAMRSQSWREATATIVHSDIYSKRFSYKVNNHLRYRNEYIVKAKYQYEANGKPYTGSRFAIGAGDVFSGPYKKRNEARSWLNNSPYKTGNSITIYYDPDNPGESVASNAFQWVNLIPFAIALLFMSIVLILNKINKSG